ncbi:hypothetical protein ACL02T_16800 [Pseudonocardia sp. RS010]|uniref:hypothetical protein n=1 Tax=Pseudonocardia sp. RS010 TaxID=3385979 RepID=UPI0039A31E00
MAAAACVIAVGGLAGQAASMRSPHDTEVAQSRDLGRIVTGLPDAGAPRPLGTFGRGHHSAGPSGAVTTLAVSLEPGRIAPVSPTRVVASGHLG